MMHYYSNLFAFYIEDDNDRWYKVLYSKHVIRNKEFIDILNDTKSTLFRQYHRKLINLIKK